MEGHIPGINYSPSFSHRFSDIEDTSRDLSDYIVLVLVFATVFSMRHWNDSTFFNVHSSSLFY